MDIFVQIGAFIAGILALFGGGIATTPTYVPDGNDTPAVTQSSGQEETTITSTTTASQGKNVVYSKEQLLALADDKYASGEVPLGDYKYVTDAPKKGYIYLCNVHKDNPGSMTNGPWMHTSTWNFLEKISIVGAVSWSNASFSNLVSGALRVLTTNALPINHTTGTFPVAKSDPASAYDPNPNTISTQTIRQAVPATPAFSDAPYCMGGEVGIMLSGVPLFNAFDAGLRDAQAHELQDSCEGHPQGSGEYHYHGMSSCFKDIGIETVLGYAYDGFPITGPKVADKKYLTTEDLDVCHGITSDVIVDGKTVTTYHYVMTQDFPYSASCFRGKPATTGASTKSPSSSSNTLQNGSGQGQSGTMGTPPTEALAACSGKTANSSCSFTTPHGIETGTCRAPQGATLACAP